MNQNFFFPSSEDIKNTLNTVDEVDWEIINWNQAVNWQNKAKTVIDKDCKPHYIVFPQTIAILSQLVNLAHQNSWQISPLGNGTKIRWGNLINRVDLFVSTNQLNQIVDHAVEDLTVTVQAGVKLKDLQEFLATHNQFLPIDPFYDDSATIGGIVATANAGNWRQRYGGVRDLILGLSIIRADGLSAKAGGKVVKNVAGYDLMKLFTGSYGSLGIITEVTFRLYPLPESSASLVITGITPQIKLLQQQILQSSLTPTKADLISSSLVSQLNLGSSLGLCLQFQSITESVNQQLNLVQDWAEKLGLKIYIFPQTEEEKLWEIIKNSVSNCDDDQEILAKLGILPSEIIMFLEKYNDLCFVNISTGVGYMRMRKKVKSPELNKIREICQQNGGYFSILASPAQMKKQIEPWGYRDDVLKVMNKLKANFDPHQIFVNRLFSVTLPMDGYNL